MFMSGGYSISFHKIFFQNRLIDFRFQNRFIVLIPFKTITAPGWKNPITKTSMDIKMKRDVISKKNLK